MNSFDTFADRAFEALLKAKKKFGEYSYHDKGADGIMDTSPFDNELKKMGLEKAREQLLKLNEMEDTFNLMRSLIGGLDDVSWFEELLETKELSEHY